MKTFKHPQGYNCHIIKARYGNDRMALQLVDADDGSAICTITTNLVNERLGIDSVFIKSWSENEGILLALQMHNLGRPTGRTVHSGFVAVPEFKLDIQELNQYLSPDSQVSSDADGAPPAVPTTRGKVIDPTKKAVLILHSHVEELIQEYYAEKDELYDAKEKLSDLMHDRNTHPDVDQSEIEDATREVNTARDGITASLEKLHNYLAKQFA